MQQRDLWDDEGVSFCDPKLTAEEKPRLSRQCRAIVERLRRGRATNRELAGLALKYTARVSDCRQSGYDVRVVAEDRTTGLAWYALFEGGEEVGNRGR